MKGWEGVSVGAWTGRESSRLHAGKLCGGNGAGQYRLHYVLSYTQLNGDIDMV